ncbi:MAG: hypothetical protein QM736_02305 [Vicinamibacterales bacterium]
MEVDATSNLARAKRRPSAMSAAMPRRPANARRHHHLVEVGVRRDDRSSGRFDDVGEVCVREVIAKRGEGRRREDDVADLPQPNQQDLNRELQSAAWELIQAVPARPSSSAISNFFCSYGSIVASSMSMTGMSSLIG